MMERLFAVGEQREVFLLWLACGFVWGILMHGAEFVRKRTLHWGMIADAVSVTALLAMILTVLVHTHEGVRLYGLLAARSGHPAEKSIRPGCKRQEKRIAYAKYQKKNVSQGGKTPCISRSAGLRLLLYVW